MNGDIIEWAWGPDPFDTRKPWQDHLRLARNEAEARKMVALYPRELVLYGRTDKQWFVIDDGRGR